MGDATRLEFGVLGPLEVLRGTDSLTPSAAKQRALLALLLLNANTVVSSDRLIDELWGADAPATAQSALQVHVSQLRRVLEAKRAQRDAYEVVVTRPPGYLLRVAPDQLDLQRFERLVAEGVQDLADGRSQAAAERLGEGLALWRGPALADLLFEPFAQVPAARLEELRVAALEKRIDADLGCGRHAELVGELQQLCAVHPTQEGIAGQLMLALYRSGRQAEALDVYQKTRAALVDELGIDPGPALQRREHDILVQNPELEYVREYATPAAAPAGRAVLVLADDDERLDDLLALAGPLLHGERPHELVLARLLDPADSDQLADVAASLGERRQELEARGANVRVAAFTSSAYVDDVVRLASRSEIDLLLCAAPVEAFVGGAIDDTLAALLRQVLCDVAVLVSEKPDGPADTDGPVLVPFGGGEHEWAALELGAWLAGSSGRPLHLLGTTAESELGARDASRLLADAGLLIQRSSGVAPVPQLVASGHEGVVEAAAEGGLLVIGLSERWSDGGLGMTRWAIARSVLVPVLFVRRGVRPGGLAPDVSMTRFGWSVVAQP
jgi:DNA-binding SARP family transcriptional activator